MSEKAFSIDQFRNWGSQGGKRKGKSKIRGDSQYYKDLAAKRKKKAK